MIKFLLSVLFYLVFAANSFAAVEKMSVADQKIANQDISSNGKAIVIIGLSDFISAASLSDSVVLSKKAHFLSSAEIVNSQANQHIEIIDELVNLPYVVAEVNATGLATLQSHGQIASIEANRLFEVALKSSVPKVFGFSNPWNSSVYNGSGTWIAIIDSGVYTKHPMFQGKKIIQACFTTDRSCLNNTNTQIGGNAADPKPKGKSDHGTHVAGIALGRYIASQRMGGVAHKADLIALQVFNKDGSANSGTSTASMLRALNYVYTLSASRRIAAANMSIQGALFTQACDSDFPSLATAVKKLRNRKVATVIAAGNQGDDVKISQPGCLSEGIAVANATKDFRIYQPAPNNGSNRNTMVSLAAPGAAIRSATIGTGYTVKYGTSMAAPMIAGAFAVLRKQKPTATVSAIEAALQNASRAIKDNFKPGDDYFHFWPLINKARTNVGGTTKATTAVGFNTNSSVNRFNKLSNTNWIVNTGTVLGAKGVAFNNGSTNQISALVFPQTILTGRVAAKMRFFNGGNSSYGILVRQGGSVEYLHTSTPSDDFHDGYRFGLTDTGFYSVFKYEHGKISQVVGWTQNTGIVRTNNWNILLATTGGRTVKFYINGVLIGQHTSQRLVYGAPGVHSFKGGLQGTVVIDWLVTKSNSTSVGYAGSEFSQGITAESASDISSISNSNFVTQHIGCPESPDDALCAKIAHSRKFRAQTAGK